MSKNSSFKKLKVLSLCDGEEARVISGYPSYLITNFGRVFKYRKTSGYTGMKISNNSTSGYSRVELYKDSLAKKFLVHRLVALNFLRTPNENEVVNHKDGNKENNNLLNLEWVSRSENQKHAYRLGLQKGYRKSTRLSDNHRKKLVGSRWNHEQHIYTIEGKKFSSSKEASQILKLCRKEIWRRCKSAKYPEWSKEVIYAKNVKSP